jgi:hypothetical protein
MTVPAIEFVIKSQHHYFSPRESVQFTSGTKPADQRTVPDDVLHLASKREALVNSWWAICDIFDGLSELVVGNGEQRRNLFYFGYSSDDLSNSNRKCKHMNRMRVRCIGYSRWRRERFTIQFVRRCDALGRRKRCEKLLKQRRTGCRDFEATLEAANVARGRSSKMSRKTSCGRSKYSMPHDRQQSGFVITGQTRGAF